MNMTRCLDIGKYISGLGCALALVLTVSAAPAAPESGPDQDEEKVLNLFAWADYMPQSVLEQFSKETGIKVVATTFESNEAMYAKLKLLRGTGYDVVVPSTYYVELLRRDDLLSPLDKSLLGPLDMLDPRVLNPASDPGNVHSIPYMWGVTGLLVNKKAAEPATITSWNDLNRPEFKGRLLLGDDPRDSFGVALKALGYSVNSTDENEIREAYEWLRKLKPSVRVFDANAVKQTFISEDVLAGVSWNGDAFIAMQENPDLAFIYPKEGTPLWLDSLVIPKGAEHKKNAHAFIKFLLRPDIAARSVEEFNYTTPNLEARKLLPKEQAQSRAVLPTEEDLKNSEFQVDVGKARELYDRYWEKLKAGE